MEANSFTTNNKRGEHNGEKKYTPFSLEDAEKLVRGNEKLIGRNAVKTEGFEKSIVFLLALTEQIWTLSQEHKSFRMELYYDAETLNTNYCFFAPNDKCE